MNNPVTVYATTDLVDAERVRSALEAADVPCVCERRGLDAIFGLPARSYVCLVAGADRERAERVVAALPQPSVDSEE